LSFVSVALHDFRNYPSLEIELGRGLNVFSGKNASGKTNILEALYLLTLCRSFRATRERDMISFEKRESIVTGLVRKNGIDKRVGVRIFPNGKSFHIAGERVTTSSVIGLEKTVLVLPDDLSMVDGAPSSRRHVMNTTLSQQRAGYYSLLQDYNRILKQKSTLAKEHSRTIEGELFDTYDLMLAKNGRSIEERRIEWIESFSRLVMKYYSLISGYREKVEVRLKSDVSASAEGISSHESASAGTPMNCDEFENRMLKLNRDSRARGDFSSRGPHRDDLVFFLDEREASRHASRGQMKSIALSVRLAQAELLQNAATLEFKSFEAEKAAKSGESADESESGILVLVDDLGGEIDEERLRNFMKALPRTSQVVVTTVKRDAVPLEKDEQICYFNLVEGRVEKIV
jgi:DNA replication and repair protein RecF